MKTCLPAPIEDAAGIAKLTTGLASAVASVWFPPAAIAGPLLSYLVDRFNGRAQDILLKELEAGNVTGLSPEQVVQYVPMAYKFFEAAKEGEYEHNLRVLAAYITNELKQEMPDAPGFARMAKRIEGLTKLELKVIALINAFHTQIAKGSNVETTQSSRPFVLAGALARDQNNKDSIGQIALQEVLAELSSRGLLVADGATRLDKAEEYYYASQAFLDLIAKAKQTIDIETS